MKPTTHFVGVCCIVSVLSASCALSQVGVHANRAFLEETDPALAGDAMPAILKIVEIAHRTYPDNRGYRVSLASMYMLYANAFMEGEAFYLMDSDYERARGLQTRAGQLYRRAAALLEPLLQARSPGLLQAEINIYNPNDGQAARQQRLIGAFRPTDIDILYYFAAANLAGFALEPMDFESAQRLPLAILLLRQAMALNPDYNGGMVRELAVTAYASLPETMGGNRPEAEGLAAAILADKTIPASAGFHVGYALTFCVAANDYALYASHLQEAIELSADTGSPSLLNRLAARKAAWLLANADRYFDLPPTNQENTGDY